MDANGATQTINFECGPEYKPVVSRDGRFVVFSSDRGELEAFGRIDIAGTIPVS